MFVSVFDVFKVSVGPSSSHTMGPMLAAGRFLEAVKPLGPKADGATLTCTLYGSLAFTGAGHGTIDAVLAGCLGLVPETYDKAEAEAAIARLHARKCVALETGATVELDPETGIILDKKTRLDAHPNGMRFALTGDSGTTLLEETYFSIGGGFIKTAAEIAEDGTHVAPVEDVPYPFSSAAEMLEMGAASGLTIAQMKRENECARLDGTAFEARLLTIWEVMNRCIDRGLAATGELPGGLHVKRRAKAIFENMTGSAGRNEAPLHSAIDWLAAYAMAVNEENAAGGQVVTAPTNGAAGVFPAVMRYYLDHVPGADSARIPDMLLVGAAIGGLIKYNASISGAEVGCQGEVGSASAMAAAALCAALGGTDAQIENAAEIALEHHLGMTCDPVRGLVQVPCIERNGLGAVKAVAAASLAMQGDGSHIVPLDACIETMRQTGKDMDERYKETSLGGLSVSVPDC
ncbi:L-serine ammonia-lyase [Pelagibacterium xiamenense]|uniref:L-serine ammonia-lyase n=1 Tax=Pelagibacterium xiamenense TaxID=2901140 RepID=UPI001E311EB7|nr:L-serine ammonia-lyase [Pelagibacterium xiamenense]MCD7060421.1 L-serine ammonia-lyase [Pelagibacterium xiamenense]